MNGLIQSNPAGGHLEAGIPANDDVIKCVLTRLPMELSLVSLFSNSVVALLATVILILANEFS